MAIDIKKVLASTLGNFAKMGIASAIGDVTLLAILAGTLVEGTIGGVSSKKLTGQSRLLSAIQEAVDDALTSPEFELSHHARNSILSIFRPENVINYKNLSSVLADLEQSIRLVLKEFDEYDEQTFPFETLIPDAINRIKQAVLNNHDLTSLIIYENTEKIIELLQNLYDEKQIQYQESDNRKLQNQEEGIVIPSSFSLPQNSYVYKLIDIINPIFKSPNYLPKNSLNDIRHINTVLVLATELITDDTLIVLEPNHIELLVSAIIIHDIGLFIKSDGLQQLLFGIHKDTIIPFLSEKTWQKEWEDFYYEAKRYDDKKLIEIFGDNSLIPQKLEFGVPLISDIRQKQLYEYFLRKNHHRLAYDIVRFGFPGYCDIFGELGIDNITKDIIGQIAFSHGVRLRDMDSYIENHEQEIEDLAPIYYLMSVLRLASLLAIGMKRPKRFENEAGNFISHISKKEFDLNQCVTSNKYISDKKQRSINGSPESSSVFVSFENYIEGVQDELDLCWAVLAEHYRYDYELSIHRIKSNIYEEKKIETFSRKFLTKRAEIRANAELLKQLVAPLYGSQPTYGIRELLQNAVDACNEREEYCKKHSLDFPESQITIRVDTENNKFSIRDNGIGMNEDVLLNYFLVAGASYRSSESWRNNFLDENKSAIFARSGRFGIGALAAFLIGDTIKVKTKHIDDELGYVFEYGLMPEILNVERADVDDGTLIEINFSNSVSEMFTYSSVPMISNTVMLDAEIRVENNHMDFDGALEFDATSGTWWNWFHLEKPNVDYYFNNERIGNNRFVVPPIGIETNNWLDIRGNTFEFMKINPDGDYRYTINGFTVPHLLLTNEFGCDFGSYSVYIEDKNNQIITDLSRSIVTHFPDELIAVREIYKYHLAQLLSAPYSQENYLDAIRALVVHSGGYTLFSDSFLNHCKVENIFICALNPSVIANQLIDCFNVHSNYYVVKLKSFAHHGGGLFNTKLELNNKPIINNSTPDDTVIKVWLNSHYYSNEQSIIHPKYLNENSMGISIYENSMRVKSILPYDLEKKLFELYPLIIEYNPIEERDGTNIMSELLIKYLPVERTHECKNGTVVNGGWIPFDIEDRMLMYPEAFSDLEKYIINDFD